MAGSRRESMWVTDKTGRKRAFWDQTSSGPACGELIFRAARCPPTSRLSLPLSAQTVPKVQTFWWCCCRWRGQSCSWVWRRCLSGSCWWPSMTGGSLLSSRRSVPAPSGTRWVGVGAACERRRWMKTGPGKACWLFVSRGGDLQHWFAHAYARTLVHAAGHTCRLSLWIFFQLLLQCHAVSTEQKEAANGRAG